MIKDCILNALQTIFSSVSMAMLLHAVFGYRRRRNRTVFYFLIVVFAIFSAAIPLLIKNGETSEWLNEITVFAATASLPYFLLEPIKKRTFFFFGVLYCATCDYTVAIISSVAPQMNKTAQTSAYLVIYLCVITASIFVEKKSNRNIPSGFIESLNPLIYIILFIADLAVCYEVDMKNDSSYYAEVSDVLKLTSTALVVGCISYIVYKYLDSQNKQQQTKVQLEIEIAHYEEMMRRNRDVRTFRHDYKNNLSSLAILIDSGRYQEAREYINEIEDAIETTKNRFTTGNYFADAILSDKADQALKKGIDITFSGTLPEKGISNYDLCTVLTNALDNAVRGCAGCEPCAVKINGIEKNNVLKIIIKNPVVKNVEIKNNSIKTTKNDSLNHGIGISNMRRTVKKYDGYISLECDNNEFKTEIGLIIKKDELK